VKLLTLVFLVVCTLGGCAEPSYAGREDAAALLPCSGGACEASVPAVDRTRVTSSETDGSQPSSASDAGIGSSEPSNSASDAGSGAQPAASDLLLGRYGVRARTFSNDLPARVFGFQHEELMLAEIRADPADHTLKMTVELCKHSWQLLSADGSTQDAMMLFPQLWPKRTYTVHHENGAFFTTGGSVAVGYDAAPLTDCGGLAKAPRRAEQSWISGPECSCPQTSALPIKPEDCRIVDTDKDGRAGVTVQQTSATGPILGSTRIRDASQLQYGKVQPNGKHTAELLADVDYFVLSCDPAGTPCVNSGYVYCPANLQPVVFEPLSREPARAGWSCPDLVAQYAAGNIFSDDPLKFPAACR